MSRECWENNKTGYKPVISNRGQGAWVRKFFACPRCGSEVGGFTITGGGQDDWGTHTDNFCKECGIKIDWSTNDLFEVR